jgi:hypothetical protein
MFIAHGQNDNYNLGIENKSFGHVATLKSLSSNKK